MSRVDTYSYFLGGGGPDQIGKRREKKKKEKKFHPSKQQDLSNQLNLMIIRLSWWMDRHLLKIHLTYAEFFLASQFWKNTVSENYARHGAAGCIVPLLSLKRKGGGKFPGIWSLESLRAGGEEK